MAHHDQALAGLEASAAWRNSALVGEFTVEEVYGPSGKLRVLGHEWDSAHAMSGALMQNMGGGVPIEVIRELVRQCSPDGYLPPLRIATWNVERPKPRGWKIPPAQRERMAEVGADIWVLTETHLDHQPTPEHTHCAFSPPHPERRPEHERWVGIWSRWPLTELTDPPAHRRGSLAVEVATPWGPVIVYGTVLAWANERHFDDGTPARMWEVHNVEVRRQVSEWVAIANGYPGVPFIVAGDFNQDRDGSGWYGSATARRVVTEGLEAAGLECVTAFDAVAEGRLVTNHLVDHICVSRPWAHRSTVELAERIDTQGRRLSDHPTVTVEIDLDPADIELAAPIV
jgi:endonuclease/exonuclease/phosphatase family metal-dependent hydrolase